MAILQFGSGYYPEPNTNKPLAGGEIYVGLPNTDPEVVANQIEIQVQQEDGSIVVVAQPIYLSGGGVPIYNGSPIKILVDEDHSLKVNDKNGTQVYYYPNLSVNLGFQGPQGVAGSQGYQGDQGAQGYQGFQGQTGSQGPQGVKGFQGFQGDTGPQGYQGAQGNQGIQGSQGVTGFQGTQGVTGSQGYQGAQGNQGIQGAQGQAVQGPQGDIGSQGYQGNSGATGAQGPRGYQGYQGTSGAQGAQGIQGAQGTDGLSITWGGAYSGAQTYDQGDGISFNGSLYVSLVGSNTGNQPDTSPSQWEEFAGAQGPQGAAGAQGVQGSVGSQGAEGPQGVQGATGSQGNQGPQGNIGSQGATGAQGTQGFQGTTGPQGVQGNQGYTGSQGQPGSQGTQGFQGSTGPQGVQGNQGFTGSQGADGAQGTQGYQGSQGAQGLAGPQGTIGAQGATGSQGLQGSQGPDGNQGPQGPQGLLSTVLSSSVTIVSGGLLKIGSGTKDSTLDGIAIDNTEIVGQIDGVDTFALKVDGSGWFGDPDVFYWDVDGHIGINLNNLEGVTAGDDEVLGVSAGGESSAGGYTYLDQVKILMAGEYRVITKLWGFDFSAPYDADIYCKVYKNGVAYGSQLWTVCTPSGSQAQLSEDLTFEANDYCQIYAWTEQPSVDGANCTLKLYTSNFLNYAENA